MWAGIAGAVVNNNTGYEIAISIHDSVYNTDFASTLISYDPTDPEAQAANIERHVIESLRKFSQEHLCKFLGAGVTLSLLREVRSCIPTLVIPNSNNIIPVRLRTCAPGSGSIWTSFPSCSTSSLSILTP